MPETIEAFPETPIQEVLVQSGTSVEALPVLLSDAPESSAYGNICDLIRNKTRFEPADVDKIKEQDEEQSYSLEVRYTLEARVEKLEINGLFVRTTQDHECDNDFAFVQDDAEDECPSRLKQAAALLRSGLEQSETAYNGIAEGLLLKHDCKHWHLHDCFSCSGSGRVSCHTCDGERKETCWRCNGGLFIICDAYGCLGGQQNCLTCGGRGHVSRQVSYQTTVQVPTTTWSNGVSQTSYHTEYRTEYRTEQDPCPSYNCFGGKIQCSRCSGTGRIQCPTCFATGKVTCRTCSGVGDLSCEPCSASGKLGDAAWVDVYAKPTYHLQLPDGCPDDAQAIVGREGSHGIAGISQSIGLVNTEVDNSELPSSLTASYQGVLRIVRLDTRCNGDEYHLVAYGNDLRWMTTDSMVEDLLHGDLKALQTVLSETADDGLLSSKIDHLLLPLKHVTASELNADVVEAALSRESHQSYEKFVSADYVRDIQKGILGALRQIYTRLAKQLWWQVAVACLVVTTVIWALLTPLWGMLSGAFCLAGGSFLFTRRVRRILSDALGNPALADRAISMAHNSKRTYFAHALILIPGAISTLVFGMMLPAKGLLSSTEPESMPDSLPTANVAHPTISAKPAGQPPKYDLPAKPVQALEEPPMPIPPKADPVSSNKPSPKPTPKKTEVAPTKPKQSLDDLLK